MEWTPKLVLGLTGIGAVTVLQCVAWLCGHNGAVFALTSSVIGGVIGFTYGTERNIKQSIAEYVEEHKVE